MHSAIRLIAVLTFAGAHTVALAGGGITALPVGSYTCEVPGRADGPAALAAPKESFTILSGTTYQSAEGRGLYLYTGGEVTMTTGPLKGARYVRDGDGFLRRVDEKARRGMRCVRMY